MDAIERLETTVYGDPSRQHKGLSERVNEHDAFIRRWDKRAEKMLWALITGACGALGSLGIMIKIVTDLARH